MSAGSHRTYDVVMRQLRARAHLIAGIIGLVIVSAGVSLVAPLLVKRLIDEAIPARDVSLIALLLVGIVLFPLVAMTLGAVQNYLRAGIGEAVSQSLRQALFNHLLYVRMRDLERIESGRIIQTLTRVCGEIGEKYVTNELLPVFTNAVLLLGTLGVMLFLNVRLLLVSMVAVPFFYLFAHWMRTYAERLDSEFLQVLEQGMNHLQDAIPGMRTIRAHTAAPYEAARWLKWLKVHWHAKAKTVTFHNLVLTLPLDLMQNVGVGFVYGYAAYEVINGRLEIGGLVAYIMLVHSAYTALEAILSGHISTGQAKAAAERIDSLLALPCEENPPAAEDAVRGLPLGAGRAERATDANDGGQAAATSLSKTVSRKEIPATGETPPVRAEPVEAPSVRTSTGSARTDGGAAREPGVAAKVPGDIAKVTGSGGKVTGGAAIEFSHVSFDYGRDGFGLEDVSFRAAPGAFIGVVGPSGGGKSTIIDLLLRFYPPRSGAIRVDGADIGALPLPRLRGMISLVPQDVFLWNDSIYANLVYPARDVPRARIVAAAKAAQLHDFVESLPNGYDTRVGERGVALSGGERQRLALCRAMLAKSRILLLDEATSALDALIDQKVRAALETARQGRTTIVVAHRLLSVMRADTILAVDQGKLVQEGAPQTLRAQPGLFRDLYEAQKL